MKRIVVGLLAIVLACTALSGCAATQLVTGKEESVTAQEAVVTRIAALKGPTAMGIVKMLEDDKEAESPRYDAALYTAADEIVPLIGKGEVDIALVPTNLAATLYKKTEGGIAVIDVNAGDVLYGVSNEENSFYSVSQLKGKVLYMTGKGTTPEWSLRYLLSQNEMTMNDLTVEFKSEPTEIVSLLTQNPDAVAILPQPFATVAVQQNDSLRLSYSMSDEWQMYSDQSIQAGTATGVTIVRRTFLEKHPEAVKQFIEAHKASVDYMRDNPEEGANLIEAYGISKAEACVSLLKYHTPLIAVAGEKMKAWVQEYLEHLYEIAPEAVGGEMPDDAFYYVG